MDIQLEVITPLTSDEKNRLGELEVIIETGRDAFLRVGQALSEISQHRLYRDSHPSFEAYCLSRWGFSRQQGYRLMNAFDIQEQVLPIGDITRESHARALFEELTDAEDRRLAFKVACATAPDGKVTEEHIRTVSSVLFDAKNTGGSVDTGDGEMTALEAAVTQETLDRVHAQQAELQRLKDEAERRKNSVRVAGISIPVKSLIDLSPELARALRAYDEAEIVKLVVYAPKLDGKL